MVKKRQNIVNIVKECPLKAHKGCHFTFVNCHLCVLKMKKTPTDNGPSINDVGQFFRFYDPPPSPFVVFLLSKFLHF